VRTKAVHHASCLLTDQSDVLPAVGYIRVQLSVLVSYLPTST